MAYLTTDERTDVLLELIEDAEFQLNQDDDSAALLRTVIATAKRHPHWPETQRKRDEEYKLQKAKEPQSAGVEARATSTNLGAPIDAPAVPELTPI